MKCPFPECHLSTQDCYQNYKSYYKSKLKKQGRRSRYRWRFSGVQKHIVSTHVRISQEDAIDEWYVPNTDYDENDFETTIDVPEFVVLQLSKNQDSNSATNDENQMASSSQERKNNLEVVHMQTDEPEVTSKSDNLQNKSINIDSGLLKRSRQMQIISDDDDNTSESQFLFIFSFFLKDFLKFPKNSQHFSKFLKFFQNFSNFFKISQNFSKNFLKIRLCYSGYQDKQEHME